MITLIRILLRDLYSPSFNSSFETLLKTKVSSLAKFPLSCGLFTKLCNLFVQGRIWPCALLRPKEFTILTGGQRVSSPHFIFYVSQVLSFNFSFRLLSESALIYFFTIFLKNNQNYMACTIGHHIPWYKTDEEPSWDQFAFNNKVTLL